MQTKAWVSWNVEVSKHGCLTSKVLLHATVRFGTHEALHSHQQYLMKLFLEGL